MFKETVCALFVVGAVVAQSQSGKDALKNILFHFTAEGSLKGSIDLVKSDGADRKTVFTEYGTGFGSMCGEDKIVAAINGDDRNTDIYIMKRDGSDKKKLTTNNKTNYWPVASPNGKKIVFISDRDGDEDIYIMDADGSNQKQLTNVDGNDYDPSISKDGTKVVFVSDRDGNPEIYMINADGTGETRITNHPAAESSPMISPDGKKILFSTNRVAAGDLFQLHTMDLKGENVVALTTGDKISLNPSYSMDGSMIVYISRETMVGVGTLMRMNADGSSITDITKGVKGNYSKTNGWIP